MLYEVLGYDRFREISGQYAVKGRWADWAVTVNETLLFFVEVKPIGTKLRDRDLFQVVSYSRQHNLEWAVLTTGDVWQCHRIPPGDPEVEECFELHLLDAAQPLDELVERFYLLSKEGFAQGALGEYWDKAETFRPERLSAILLSEEVLGVVRRCVHRDNPGRRINVDDLKDALVRGVIRGDLAAALAAPATVADGGKQAKKPAKE